MAGNEWMPKDAVEWIPSGAIEVIDSKNNNKDTAITAGSVLIGGAAAIGAGKWMADPFINKMQLHNNRVTPLKKSLGIEHGVQTSDLPGVIGKKISSTSEYNNNISKQFKTTVNNFDKGVRNGIVKETANNLIKNYPTWRNSGFTTYGQGLKSIEDILAKSGVTFSPQAFNENVINNTANIMESRGFAKEAENLKKYANTRSWGVDADGAATGKPITFSNAKQAVTQLANQNPNAARELKANWGQHLETDPMISKVPTVSTKLQELNKAYVPFKQSDNVAYKLMNPNTGTLDTTKITNALHNYVLGAKSANPQTTAFLKSLGNDSSMAAPIPGVSAQADAIDSVVKQRNDMHNVYAKTVSDNATNIEKLKNAQTEALTLSSLEKGLDKKILNRKIVGGIGATAATGGGFGVGRALGLLSGAPQLLGVANAYQAAKARPDSNFMQGLTDMLYNSQSGNNLYSVQQAAQKALGYGDATNQDMNTLQNAGVTQEQLDKMRRLYGPA